MDFQFATIAVLALLVLSLLFHRRRYKGDNKKRRFHPIVGTVLHQFLHFHRLHDYHTDLSRKHKTFRLLAPHRNQIYTSDPANIEYILKSNFTNYGKGSYNYCNMKDLFGDGIFAVDGDKWRQQRKLASMEFSTRVLRDFSSVVFKNNAAKLAKVVSEAASSRLKMDFQDLLLKSTMDSICKVGFGMELNSLDNAKDGMLFAKAFDDSSESIMSRYTNPFWKIMKFFNIGLEARLKEDVKLIDDFVYNLIRAKIEQMADDQNDPTKKKEDILSRFLEEMKKNPENMNHQYLRDIILNFLIAGKDTTAGALSWFLFMICKHPLVEEKVVQEVRQVIKANEDVTFDEFSMMITDEALDKMHYLHAAFSETLRLYPSVPLDNKVCFSDDTLPDGFSVRKDDAIFYQPYAMGRMEYLWGEDAEVFRPERWLDDDGLFHSESPFKFTAFQAGPRICLGKDFAYRQMKIFAAVLLRFFVFKLSDENRVINYRTMITLHIDQGLHLEAFCRK